MGNRKGDTDKRLSHRIHTRVTQRKYDELSAILGQSIGIHSLSELLRNILDNKTIAVKTYDTTMNSVMTELSAIRTELNAIGNNINQVTHRFHLQQSPEGRLYEALEVGRLYQQTDQKITELFTIIANISEKWLPK